MNECRLWDPLIEQNSTGCRHLCLPDAGSLNFDKSHVDACADRLKAKGLPQQLMVDASHGNSEKDYRNQPAVIADLCTQIADGSKAVASIMIESNIIEGAQKLGDDPSKLVYGQSVTDQCISWQSTEDVIDALSVAVKARRAL